MNGACEITWFVKFGHANDDKRRLGEEILYIGKKRFLIPYVFYVYHSTYKTNKAPRIFALRCSYAKVKMKSERQ